MSAVACDDGAEIVRAYGEDAHGAPVEFFDGSSQYLPLAVAKWLGLEHWLKSEVEMADITVTLDEEFFEELDPDLHDSWKFGDSIGLADLNDGGVPFTVIAGLIERQW